VQWPRELALQLTHPLALLLWVAALLSFIVGSITVGVAVVLIIVLNAAVAFVQERHAANAVDALAGYIPQKLTVVRDGTRSVIDTAELVPADIALLEEGERIGADMRLISGAVEVDLSTLTGESVPAMRSAEYHDRGRPRLEARELLFSGLRGQYPIAACSGGRRAAGCVAISDIVGRRCYSLESGGERAPPFWSVARRMGARRSAAATRAADQSPVRRRQGSAGGPR
jgi:E1-E2 ATPase